MDNKALIYSIFSGIGGVLFYDLRIRENIEAARWGYGEQEIVIVVLWSLIFSICASISLLSLDLISRNLLRDVIKTRVGLSQVPISILIATVAVIATLFIQRPADELNQFRGFLAGTALRLGLFYGIVISILRKPNEDFQDGQ